MRAILLAVVLWAGVSHGQTLGGIWVTNTLPYPVNFEFFGPNFASLRGDTVEGTATDYVEFWGDEFYFNLTGYQDLLLMQPIGDLGRDHTLRFSGFIPEYDPGVVPEPGVIAMLLAAGGIACSRWRKTRYGRRAY